MRGVIVISLYMSDKEWIVTLRFLGFVALVFAAEGFYLLRFIIRYILRKTTKRDLPGGFATKPALAVHVIAATGVACFLYGYLIEPRMLEVTSLTVRTDKLKKTSFRIVQISDTHLEDRAKGAEYLSSLINPLRPDIVVFTGDAINSMDYLEMFREQMSGINAGLGKFSVTGNWDVAYFRDADMFFKTGFRILDNNTLRLEKDNEPLYISGVGYSFGNVDLRFLSNVPEGAFSVFLYHKPDFVYEAQEMGVDLYLTGHTHGGQVALPFYGAFFTLAKHGKRFEAGRYLLGGMTIYVNRGIGMEGGYMPRVRFLARPEITVIDIVPSGRETG